jgi:hypothetical protein
MRLDQATTMTKISALVIVCALLVPVHTVAELNQNIERDRALERIEACERSNYAFSPSCGTKKNDVQFLTELYRKGDKSVLPALLHLKYLSDFYNETLLADPDSFLDALGSLPQGDLDEVALAMAGGGFRTLEKRRFENVRLALLAIPDTSPLHTVAAKCLRTLESNNASLFLDYFPPRTFASRAAPFQVVWYSRDLYSLGEMPLWPPSASARTVYRFTLLGSFSEPQTVILTISSDGSGKLSFKHLSASRDALPANESSTLSSEQVASFLEALKQADFWRMPAESTVRGYDGAEWILEGAEAGSYHLAVRWSPLSGGKAPESAAFASAAQRLLELAGHKLK